MQRTVVGYRLEGWVEWGWEADVLSEEQRRKKEQQLLAEVVRLAEQHHPKVNAERFGSVLTAVRLEVRPVFEEE